MVQRNIICNRHDGAMTLRKRLVVVGVVAVSALLVGACGHAQPPPPSSAAGAPTAGSSVSSRVVPARLVAKRSYSDMGITLDVPALDVVPAADGEQAYQRCVSGPEPCPHNATALPPTVELALYSNSTYGTTGKNGTVIPKFQRTLTWVITFHDVPMRPAGGPGMTFPQAPTPCEFIYLVDASTGGYMMAIGCPGKPT